MELAALQRPGHGAHLVDYPPSLHPAFPDTPFAQVVVELVEGPRVLSTVVDVAPDQLEIGMPVIVEFHRVTDEVTLPRFAPAPHPHRPSDEPCPSASC